MQIISILEPLKDALLRLRLARGPYQRRPGAGVARAATRLAEHRKTFSHVDLTPDPSRQQRRAEERAFMKKVRSADKAEALRSGAMGGAAACR